MGLAIGALLAAANVYIGLKAPFMDGGAITAVLLSFTFFATLRRFIPRRFTVLETNIAQTAAASAAIASMAQGLTGPIPGAHLMGRDYPGWLLVVWGVGLGVIGLQLAAMLRRKLIDEERLPFPTGAATAEVIQAVHAHGGEAVHRTKLLVGAAAAAMLVTWLRDGPQGVVPQATYLPLTIAGLGAATLNLGISYSPLMAATGVFMGLRTTLSLFGGALFAWGFLAPLIARHRLVPEVSYGALVNWMIWPALALMTASTLVSFLLDWRSIARSLRDLGGLLAPGGGRPRARLGGWQVALTAVCVASTVVAGWRGFGLHPAVVIAVLVLAVALTGICARAAGETDIGPVLPLATLTQILFGRYGAHPALMLGSIVVGETAPATQSLWAYKTGQQLAASPRAQFVAQLGGLVAGALVVVPVYLLLVRVYGVGTEHLPAPAALSWKATAEAVGGGGAHLPRYGLLAAACGLALGTLLAVLDRTRLARFLPSGTAIGIAFITPAALTVAAFVGVVAVSLIRRARPSINEGSVYSIAAGALAGESLMGVAIALLMAMGWIR